MVAANLSFDIENIEFAGTSPEVVDPFRVATKFVPVPGFGTATNVEEVPSFFAQRIKVYVREEQQIKLIKQQQEKLIKLIHAITKVLIKQVMLRL